MTAYTLIPAPGGKQADLWEFKVSRVYIASSRPGMATKQNLKRKKKIHHFSWLLGVKHIAVLFSTIRKWGMGLGSLVNG